MTISPRRGQRQAEMVTREISKLPRPPPHVQNRSEARMRPWTKRNVSLLCVWTLEAPSE